MGFKSIIRLLAVLFCAFGTHQVARANCVDYLDLGPVPCSAKDARATMSRLFAPGVARQESVSTKVVAASVADTATTPRSSIQTAATVMAAIANPPSFGTMLRREQTSGKLKVWVRCRLYPYNFLACCSFLTGARTPMG